MTRKRECAAIIGRLPDLLEEPVPLEVADHAASCTGCARDLRALREMAQAASMLLRRDVPEPPAEYWDSFLPRVRARIGRRNTAAPRRRAAPQRSVMTVAAAALIIAMAGAAAWLSLRAPAGIPAMDAEARMQAALAAIPSPERWRAAGLAAEQATQWDPLDADLPGVLPSSGRLLETLDEMEMHAAEGDRWTTDWIQERLAPLSREQAATLKAELIKETHG